MTYSNGHEKNAKITYDYELGTNKIFLTDEQKIGLMYVTDYYYSALPNYWSYAGYIDILAGDIETPRDYRAASLYSWLYLGLTEFTITKRTDVQDSGAFFIDASGIVSTNTSSASLMVRPVFYLNSNIEYSSGDGSIDNPYRIA